MSKRNDKTVMLVARCMAKAVGGADFATLSDKGRFLWLHDARTLLAAIPGDGDGMQELIAFCEAVLATRINRPSG